MPFKKIIPQLKLTLDNLGIEEPTPFQNLILSKIKSGANIFGIGPKHCGKTTALIISTIQKLKGVSNGDIPRALIFVKDNDAVDDLVSEFIKYTKRSLRIIGINERHNNQFQRDEIFEGVDIIIGTPTRLSKLFLHNGINLRDLQLLIIEDGDTLNTSLYGDMAKITQSISKCQYLIFGTTLSKNMEKLQHTIMANGQLVKL